jgi:hypothetical protein
MTAKKVQSVKDRIKGAQRPRRSKSVNLRGDLVAEMESLERRLVELRDAERSMGPPQRLGQESEQLRVAKRVDAVRKEMASHWLELVLEALPWSEWSDFKASAPAREGHEYDGQVGVDFDRLVKEIVPRCVVEPELDEEDWAALFGGLAPGDLRDLGGIAYALHESGSSVPLLPTASAVLRRSAEPSAPLESTA